MAIEFMATINLSLLSQMGDYCQNCCHCFCVVVIKNHAVVTDCCDSYCLQCLSFMRTTANYGDDWTKFGGFDARDGC